MVEKRNQTLAERLQWKNPEPNTQSLADRLRWEWPKPKGDSNWKFKL